MKRIAAFYILKTSFFVNNISLFINKNRTKTNAYRYYFLEIRILREIIFNPPTPSQLSTNTTRSSSMNFPLDKGRFHLDPY